MRAAIEIADAEGIAALSMRRVAAALGVATMSLYRHVPGKDELTLLMVDTAAGDFPFPARRPAGWRPSWSSPRVCCGRCSGGIRGRPSCCR